MTVFYLIEKLIDENLQAACSAEPQFGTSVGSCLAYVRPELGFGTTGRLQIFKNKNH